MRYLFSLFLVFSTTTAFATEASLIDTALEALAQKYLFQKQKNESIEALNLLLFQNKHMPPHCQDSDEGSNDCLDTVCSKVGSYNCDDLDEVKKAGAACLGQPNGKCIAKLCDKLGSYNCDDLSEITKVGAACKGNFSGDCVDIVCKKVGSYNCDDLSEIAKVGETCKGVSGSCIETVCAKVGSYNCDDLSEIAKVGQACKGS